MLSLRSDSRMAQWLLLLVPLVFAGLETHSATPSSPSAELAVGAAKVDLSPRAPVRLMGYAARAHSPAPTNIAQRLYARALVFGEGPSACVIVTLDNCILPAGVTETIRGRLVREHGLARERIALTVTHTHSAPCLSGAAPNIFAQDIPAEDQAAIDAYTRLFVDSTIAAVGGAMKARRPARLAWGQGRADFGTGVAKHLRALEGEAARDFGIQDFF